MPFTAPNVKLLTPLTLFIPRDGKPNYNSHHITKLQHQSVSQSANTSVYIKQHSKKRDAKQRLFFFKNLPFAGSDNNYEPENKVITQLSETLRNIVDCINKNPWFFIPLFFQFIPPVVAAGSTCFVQDTPDEISCLNATLDNSTTLFLNYACNSKDVTNVFTDFMTSIEAIVNCNGTSIDIGYNGTQIAKALAECLRDKLIADCSTSLRLIIITGLLLAVCIGICLAACFCRRTDSSSPQIPPIETSALLAQERTPTDRSHQKNYKSAAITLMDPERNEDIERGVGHLNL